MIGTERQISKSKAIHETLRQIPYNLFAVGVGKVDKEKNAFMGSWVSQCSFSPPMVAMAARKDTTSYKILEMDGVFTLNLLRRDQEDIARKLVKPHHRIGDKLGDISHTGEVTGAPVLRDCLGFIECKVVSQSDAGDHILVVGEVVNAEQKAPGRPLTCEDIGWHYAG